MKMWNEEVEGKHKPLIDESLFNQIQNILMQKKITQDRWQKKDFLRSIGHESRSYLSGVF
jgi:hypothetical protein